MQIEKAAFSSGEEGGTRQIFFECLNDMISLSEEVRNPQPY
jgi:hypothetical protein